MTIPQEILKIHCQGSYNLLLGSHQVIPAITWLWKSCSQLKHKIFFWLLIMNRLNTREMLLRKSFFIEDYTCPVCNTFTLESRDHLFFHCRFAQHCWQYICPQWTPVDSHIQGQIHNIRQKLNLPFAMDIIIHVSWAIWNTRNDFIFNNVKPSLYACRQRLKQELKLLTYRATRKSLAALPQWVESFR